MVSEGIVSQNSDPLILYLFVRKPVTFCLDSLCTSVTRKSRNNSQFSFGDIFEALDTPSVANTYYVAKTANIANTDAAVDRSLHVNRMSLCEM